MPSPRLIRQVYKGDVTTKNLSESYYTRMRGQFMKSLRTGFGSKAATPAEAFGGTNKELYASLSENVSMFSAAKTYQLTRELQVAKKGATWDEYKEQADIITAKYDRWGEAENTTITAQAQMAKQWQAFEAEKEDFPNLRYSTIGEACPVCSPYEGMVAPVGATVWVTRSPALHFFCYCLLLQEDSSVKLTNEDKINAIMKADEDKINPIFLQNPGQSGIIFNDSHSYFEVLKGDKRNAKKNWGLPI